MNKLPDELLVNIIGRCALRDFKQLRLVNRNLLRITGDCLIQQEILAPLVLKTLARVQRCRNGPAEFSASIARCTQQRAHALFYRNDAPAHAATSWLDLLRQAQAVETLTLSQKHLDKRRRFMAPSLWPSLQRFFSGSSFAGGLVSSQLSLSLRAEAAFFGAALGYAVVGLGVLAGIIWLLYNLVGLWTEETADRHGRLVETQLQKRYPDIYALIGDARPSH